MVKDINRGNGFTAQPSTGGVLMAQKACQSAISPIILVVFMLSPLVSSAQQLQLDISLSDTTYYVCQSIGLNVQLTNKSEDTVRAFGFQFPGGSGLNIVLMEEKGDTLKPVLLFEFLDWSGCILNPEETYYESFDLADIFDNYQVGPSAPFSYTASLAPGKYEVSAVCNLRNEKMTSSAIGFEVIEPKGSEQEALKLYKEAYEDFLQKKFNSENQKLNRITTVYPKSVYAERAYWKLFKYTEILEKLPDSGYTRNALSHLTYKMSVEKKRESLQTIIRQNPGTRSAKFAEQMLRGW